jgi:hypothetical protein
MSSRTSITAVIAVSIVFSIAQTALSHDMPEKTFRRGLNRTQRSGETSDQRKPPSSGQRDAIRRLRDRTENGPVPPGLERRKIRIGNVEREFFIHIPDAINGKPSPVVFVQHEGASTRDIFAVDEFSDISQSQDHRHRQ